MDPADGPPPLQDADEEEVTTIPAQALLSERGV